MTKNNMSLPHILSCDDGSGVAWEAFGRTFIFYRDYNHEYGFRVVERYNENMSNYIGSIWQLETLSPSGPRGRTAIVMTWSCISPKMVKPYVAMTADMAFGVLANPPPSYRYRHIQSIIEYDEDVKEVDEPEDLE